jgi:hypothetical protein
MGGPQNLFLIGILIFLLLRSPCKILKLYNNPFWGFEQRYQEEHGYIAGRARLYSQESAVIFRKSVVIFRKSAVIFPEERGYIPEERGYIAGRARLYCRKSAVIVLY